MANEVFSWKKFFSGVFDPIGYFKTLASLLRILIIVAILFLTYCVGMRIYHAIVPKSQPQPAVFTVSGQAGGQVKNSADQKTYKNALLNIF